MRRVLRPTVDTYRDNGFPNEWVTHLNGTTSLYAEVDEAYNDTADFVKVWVGATADPIVVFKLSSVPTPSLRTNHTLLFWCAYLSGAGTGNTGLTVQIREGYVNEGSPGTLIHSRSIPNTSFAGTTLQEFRDSWDGSAITDYSNLYVRLYCDVFNAAPGNDGMVVTQVYMAVPGDGILGPTGVSQFPISPIYGEVYSGGSTNGGAFGQLLNPEGSTVKLLVYELWFWGGGPSSGHTGLSRQMANAVKRSDYPFEPGSGATTVNANAIHLNETDVTTIQGILRAYDFTNEQYHNFIGQVGYEFEDVDDADADGITNISAQWIGRPSVDLGDLPTEIRRIGSFPWTIMPGSAIEIPWLDNGTGTNVRIGAVWDERPL